MGVPAFFRWLTNTSPQVVQQAYFSEREEGKSGEEQNPEIDNLYLDMNGIIHPCTHPQGNSSVPVPLSEEDMFENVRRYVDLIVRICAPRRLIYFAIDGVAPKAKMNQQRSRRFRAGQEILKSAERKRKVADALRQKGIKVPDSLVQTSHWDHNVITPGTEFMERVSNMLRAYILDNLSHNPAWKGLKVIFSDSNTPKEGEHKILDHIRLQRLQPGYDPNTK
jgi:5'-3' exoribonuclease 2